MTDAVFISDAEGRFIEFNDAFATFHRFTSKDQVPKTLAEYPDILDVYLADGQLAPLDQWAVPRALRGEAATNAEYTLRRKDTGETWVGSYSFAPIRDQDGKIVGSVVTGRDITAQKRAEEALRESERRLQPRAANQQGGQLGVGHRGRFARLVGRDLPADGRGTGPVRARRTTPSSSASTRKIGRRFRRPSSRRWRGRRPTMGSFASSSPMARSA